MKLSFWMFVVAVALVWPSPTTQDPGFISFISKFKPNFNWRLKNPGPKVSPNPAGPRSAPNPGGPKAGPKTVANPGPRSVPVANPRFPGTTSQAGSTLKNYFSTIGGKAINSIKNNRAAVILRNAANRSMNRMKKLGLRLRRPNRQKYQRLEDTQGLNEGIIATAQGGPVKQSTFARARQAVMSGLTATAETLPVLASVAGNTANAVMSVKNLEIMQQFVSTPPPTVITAGTSTSSTEQQTQVTNKKETSLCPAHAENLYVSEQRQKCAPRVSSSNSDSDIEVIGYWYTPEADISTDDEATDSRQVNSLTFGYSLKLEFTDYVITPKDGRLKKTICRRKVKALSDTRVGYAQTMAITEVEKVDSKSVQSHRYITIACATDKVPLVTLKPGHQRDIGPIETLPKREIIPEVKENGVTKLAIRGVIWATPIYNACHLTSFMTFFLLNVRKSTRYLTRNLISVQDGGENVLIELYALYMGFLIQYPNPTVSEQKVHDNKLKELWLKVFYPELDKKGPRIDFRGHETESIGEKLEKSLFYFVTYTCTCDGHQETKSRKVFLPKFTLSQVLALSRSNEKTYEKPLDLAHGITLCKTCAGQPVIKFLFVPHSTWFLFFPIIGNDPFDIAKIPINFFAHELYLDSVAKFELGYISLQTTKVVAGVLHHLSLMYLNEKFYFYDDMANGDLVLCNDPNDLYKTKQLALVGLLYFRL